MAQKHCSAWIGGVAFGETHLASLAICRDKGCVGGGGGLGTIRNHAFIDFQGVFWLSTAVASINDRVVSPHLRLRSLATVQSLSLV